MVVTLTGKKTAIGLACCWTNNPESLIRSAIMSIQMWASIKGSLSSQASDIIIREIGWNSSTAWAAPHWHRTSISKLSTNHSSLNNRKSNYKSDLMGPVSRLSISNCFSDGMATISNFCHLKNCFFSYWSRPITWWFEFKPLKCQDTQFSWLKVSYFMT